MTVSTVSNRSTATLESSRPCKPSSSTATSKPASVRPSELLNVDDASLPAGFVPVANSHGDADPTAWYASEDARNFGGYSSTGLTSIQACLSPCRGMALATTTELAGLAAGAPGAN